MKSKRFALMNAFAALFLAILAPIGYRMGWFDVLLAIKTITPLSVLFACFAVLFGIWGVVRGSGKGALFAVVIGAVIAGPMLYNFSQVQALPFIHDITTDTANPPQFKAVLKLRTAEHNSAVYAGPELAAQQRSGYPHIKTLQLGQDLDVAFKRTEKIMSEEFGWKIVAADLAAGRIEATDTTLWYGFKDDVVVRFQAKATGITLIDVRSASRVGLSDVGKNAARITKLVERLANVH